MEVASNVIGLVTSRLDGDYWRRLIAGITEYLQANELSLLCFSPGKHTQFPTEFLHLVQSRYLSGIVISPSSFQSIDPPGKLDPAHAKRSITDRCDPDDCLRYIGEIPIVYVGGWSAGVPSVWLRNGVGIRLLMKHLTGVCGRRRIAFVRGTEQHAEAEARFRAWEEFCIEYSLPHDEELVEAGGFTLHGGEAAAARILRNNANDLPDAFVVSNDQMAVGVLGTLKAAGLSVPDDVSVVGFDDLEADTTDPPLTTVRQPVFEMGYRAAEVLVKRLRAEPVELEHLFDPELIVRASCRPHRGDSVRAPASAGVGACVFLEGAYSSTEWLMPLLRQPMQAVHACREAPVNLEDHVADALELGLRRTKAREHELIACVRRSRKRGLEQLQRALSSVETREALNQAVCCHLPLLGLDRVTLASLCTPEPSSPREARIVVQCTGFPDPAAQERLGTRLACDQLVASEVRMTGGPLRLVQPLQIDGKYRGFFVVSGTLFDNPLLNELGDLLISTVARIGE